MRGSLLVASASLIATIAFASGAPAQVAEPAGRPDDAFDVMNWLEERGLHSYSNESFNAYGQFTWISSYKAPFHAPYTNLNGSGMSLLPTGEHSFTGSATLYLGLRLWQGGEAYYVPEAISERPLSNLRGIGGSIQNFELQKGGSVTPQIYRARVFLQQTIGLGGKKHHKTSDPMQLEGDVDSTRLVLRIGNFSIIDFLDRNEFAGDLRQQFFNMAFLTYAAYDFGSDARGLAFGGVAELHHQDWSLRFGRVTPPKRPNELSVELRMNRFYSDQLELEHRHRLFGMPGAVRLLGYRNRVNGGSFADAIQAFEVSPEEKNAAACRGYNYGSTNANAPDLCWVRKPSTKVGIGLNLEQRITNDLGVSFRGMVSDGKTEVFAYTPTDRSIASTVLTKGTLWKRPQDLAGIGAASNWITQVHARYLALGGVDGFVGDGRLNPGPESVFEVFYSLNLYGPTWLSADYQHMTNPGFNRDRGPVNIYAGRFHAEF